MHALTTTMSTTVKTESIRDGSVFDFIFRPHEFGFAYGWVADNLWGGIRDRRKSVTCSWETFLPRTVTGLVGIQPRGNSAVGRVHVVFEVSDCVSDEIEFTLR